MVLWSTRVVAAILLLASLIALAGCSSDAASLDGTQWRLTEWTVSSLSPADVTITAKFADGQISGSGVVNSYSASCAVGPGDVFAVGQISATEMASADPSINRAEGIYFTLLGQAGSYEVSDGTLTLYDENGNESLIFAAARSQGASNGEAGIAAVKERAIPETLETYPLRIEVTGPVTAQ
jgi:heat shock protein HslJ